MAIWQDTWKILRRPSVATFEHVAHDPDAVRNRVYIWVAVCGALGSALVVLLNYNDTTALLTMFHLNGPSLGASLLVGLVRGGVGALISFVVLVGSEQIVIRLLSKVLSTRQTRKDIPGFSAQANRRGDTAVELRSTESGSVSKELAPAMVTLALENGGTARVFELYDVADEKRLLPVTTFQLSYLASVLPKPGEDNDDASIWTVPKEALSTFISDIHTINDYIQTLSNADDDFDDEDSSSERMLLDRKAVEIGMLHESFKEALGDFDDIDITLKPINQTSPGEIGHYSDLVYVTGLFIAPLFIVSARLIEWLFGSFLLDVQFVLPLLWYLAILILSVQAIRAVYRAGLRNAIAVGLVGIVLYLLSYQVFNFAAGSLFDRLFPVTPAGR